MFVIPTASDQGMRVDSLKRKAGTGLVPKKNASSIPAQLAEAELDSLTHREQGYQLETDSLT